MCLVIGGSWDQSLIDFCCFVIQIVFACMMAKADLEILHVSDGPRWMYLICDWGARAVRLWRPKADLKILYFSVDPRRIQLMSCGVYS